MQTKEFYTFKRERNIELFYLLSCLKSSKAEDITDEILTLECALINKYQNISNLDHFQSIGRLVEYGATVCMKIRQRIIAKDMNEAGEILDQYLNGNEFIADTKNMMLPLSDDPRTFEQQKRVVFGKLRLIATITNLYRELIGVDDKIFSIIIRHVKAIYGEKSLELSNIYFMIGIFLNSTKQLNLRQKAMVCFIRAAYMRKEQGGVAWYNVALLLKEFGVKNYAMTYFNKALAMLQA